MQKKHIIKNMVFYIVVIILCFYIGINLFAKDKVIDIIGFKTYIVTSSSMEPDIDKYDLIFVKKVNEDELKPRDVISFEAYLPTNQFDDQNQRIYSLQIVTHYIGDIVLEDQTLIYKTQGATKEAGDYDSWTESDGITPKEITYDDIVGEVFFVIPWIGHILLVLFQPILLFILLFNVAIIIIIVKYIKKTKGGNA